MKNKWINPTAVLGTVFISSAVLAAEPASNLTDCPLAREPYSIDTPLIDLLIDPRVVNATQGILPELGPPFGAKPPTLAATMTPKTLTEYMPALTPKLDELNKVLAGVPVTEEAAIARCARYDHTPPELPTPKNHPALLVFEKITGFLDQPSVDAARKALREMAERRGWSITFTDNGAVFNAAQLKNYDAVVWNNNSGDVLTLSQRAAFETYVKNGGGFAGIHGAGGDHAYSWDWYVNTLIGAQFIGHPMNPQFQTGAVKTHHYSTSDITAGLQDQWAMKEEWYSFGSNPRAKGATILATLDESSYKPGALAMGDEHPLAWTQFIGDGRSFYTAIGHRPESYTEPNSAKLLEQGIAWSVGVGKTSCKDGKEIERKPSSHHH